MSNRYKVFTGRSSKDTEERLAELGVRKRGGVPNPYQDKPQPTGRSDEGEASEFSRFDHSHPTVILPETDEQFPYPNEIRFNSQQKLVRWDDGSNTWVPLSVEVASNTAPPPTAEASVAGTSLEYSRADHTHQFRFPVVAPSNAVDGASYFDTTEGIKIYVGGTPRTRVVAVATSADVQPTGRNRVGTAERYALADHSHPTAILPQTDNQTPVVGEIRFTADNRLVRWDGNGWVALSQQLVPSNTPPPPVAGASSAGTSDQYSRADHTHQFCFPMTAPSNRPDGASYFDTYSGIKVYIGGVATTRVVASAEMYDVRPTGAYTTGSANRYALADHSHPTALVHQSSIQTPVVDEIRYTTNNTLVRWNGYTWVPIGGGGLPSDNLPNPAGGNRSAGTSDEYSRADHTHNIVLEYNGNLSSPTDRQLGVWSSLDNIGNLCLAVYNQNQNRWELPFSRPLLSQTTAVPSGKGFHTSLRAELALRTQDYKQGVFYFRRNGSTTWELVGTVLRHSSESLGIVGELFRTSADLGSSGMWFLRGTDNAGNVRALPLAIRTFTQSTKPSASQLSTNAGDAYGFFISDRRLIELYPQQSDGVERPIIIPSYQISVPVLPAYFGGTGANSIQESNVAGFPAVRFYGSTSNTNLPLIISTMSFFPMGIRKVKLGVLLRSGHTSGDFTYCFDLRLIGINSNSVSTTLAVQTGASFVMGASSVAVYMTPILSVSLPTTYGDVWGVPFGFSFRRRWDLEATNSHDLYVLGFVLVPYRE